jgi:probable phosphoglycerate mutase
MEALLRLDADHRRVLGPLGNCSWSELVLQSGHWRLVRHNVWLPQPVEGGAPAPRVAIPAGASPEEGGAAAESDADAVL